MVTLHVIGSGSSGNCYLLQASSGQKLMLEAGIQWKTLLHDSYFDYGSNIVGCLISHEHIDHARAAADVTDRRIPVYTSFGTKARMDGSVNLSLVHTMHDSHSYEIGEYTVIPFTVRHDAAEPFGFLIHHPECGTICFATDFTGFYYSMENVNVWMVESNYIYNILQKNYRDGKINKGRFLRTKDTHMELGSLAFELGLQDLSKTTKIVLLHLSADNSNAEVSRRFISGKTGIPTFIADSGLTLDL